MVSDKDFTELQKAADHVLNSDNPNESMKHLARAFSLFSKETERLKTAYLNLQTRFKSLNTELERTNSQLRKKVTELNTVTCYLDNILRNIHEGIIFIDLDGIITTINDAAKKILLLDKKEILFSSFFIHFSDDFFGFSMKNALNHGLSQKLNYLTILDENNKKKEIEISTSFVHESPKPYQGIIIMLKDISEVQKLQRIANRNDRLKELGQMASTVAHEIRNPLGGIRGYASLLYRDLSHFPHLQEMAKNIIEGTKSLERLVTNVLHFSKPLDLKIKNLDISLVLKEIIKFIKIDPSFPKDIIIDLHSPHESYIVPIDKEMIKAAFLNIIVNAFQAINDKGKITISLMKNNNQCMITISDTGHGISDCDIENIFSPFFTTKKQGNGLGLSETFKIIQAHMGTIDVRSQINRGTTFTIILPMKKQ